VRHFHRASRLAPIIAGGVATEAKSRRGPVAGKLHRRAALGLTLVLGVSAGSVALTACSGGGDVKVEGTSVEAPNLASVTGTVVDGQGWQVRVIVTSGTRSFQTTAGADGSYTIRDVPVGKATVAWTATTAASGGAPSDASLGNARRDGQLQIGLTPGANRVDIQL
jgi:hypothetical protein